MAYRKKVTKTLVLLEGVDGTGKSTLAEAYRERGAEVIHRGPIPEGRTWRQEYVDDPAEALERSDLVVMDRCYVSEVVYSWVVRGRNSAATISDWHALHYGLLKREDLRVRKVYLYAPLKTLVERLLARGEQPDPETLARLQSHYRYWVDPHDGWTHVDTSLESAVERILG